MTRDTYKGESPAKKLVRAMYWWRVRSVLGWQRFIASKHLVLASREGGDIGVLQSLGVPNANIIAVEYNAEAARACKQKFPEIVIVVEDAFAVAKRRADKLGSVFFDLCSPIDTVLIERLLPFVRLMQRGAVLGVAGLRGRERADRKITGIVGPEVMQPDLQAEQDEVTAAFNKSPTLRRTVVFGSVLANRLRGARIYPVIEASMHYHSGQVPMTISAFRIERLMPSDDYIDIALGHTEDLMHVLANVPYPPHFTDYGKQSRAQLIEMILTGGQGESATPQLLGRMFNLPERSITAIRAHASRGSYSERARELAQNQRTVRL